MPVRPKTPRRPWMSDPDDQSARRHGRNTKFYNSKAWKRARKAYLSAHPFCECERCASAMVPLPAQMVDHIKPINTYDPYDTQGGLYGEPLDEDNFQAMNNRCHARKSGSEAHQNR